MQLGSHNRFKTPKAVGNFALMSIFALLYLAPIFTGVIMTLVYSPQARAAYESLKENPMVAPALVPRDQGTKSVANVQAKVILAGVREIAAVLREFPELINKKLFQNPFLINQLAIYIDPAVRAAVASIRDVPEGIRETFNNFLRDPAPEVRAAFAKRATYPFDAGQHLLEVLTKDEYPEVRTAIAAREDFPEGVDAGNIIRELSKDGNPAVRMAIASRTNYPERSAWASIITELSVDENSDVREAIASKLIFPAIFNGASVLNKLSLDENADVRSAAINNPNFVVPALSF